MADKSPQKDYLAQLEADFRNFLYHIWTGTVLRLPKPTKLQYLIAEHIADQELSRRGVEAFRGVGKSWITGAYALWRLFRNPEAKILVVSGSGDRADEFSTFCHSLVRSEPLLQHLMPESWQRFRQDKWDVRGAGASNAPSVKSVGIGGTLTGSRADLIIGDDCEVPNNSLTEGQREKLHNRMMEFESILKPGGEVVLLGTPQCFDTVYNKFAENGYKMKIFPARYVADSKAESYRGMLSEELREAVKEDPELVGRPTDLERFTEEELIRREAAYSTSNYLLQFMLDTSQADAERYPLKLRDLSIMPLDDPKEGPTQVVWGSTSDCELNIPNIGMDGDRFYKPFRIGSAYAPYEGVVMSIDPSGRGKDETGYAVVAQLQGKLFLLEAGGFADGYTTNTLTSLSKTAKKWGVRKIIIESNFGDGMFQRIFQPVLLKIHKCPIEEVTHNKQKELRMIDTLEPVMSQHRLVISQTLVESDIRIATEAQDRKYSMFYQMTRLSADKGSLRHDDRLEAVSIAVNYWVQAMSRDEDLAFQQYEESRAEEEINEFLEHAIGGQPDRDEKNACWSVL